MASPVRPALLKEMTCRKVLAMVRAQGPLSRADVRRLTGISAPTVSKAVVCLLEAGLVEEGLLQSSNGGRPGTLVHMATSASTVAGIEIGAQNCRAVTTGLDGNIGNGCVANFSTPQSYGRLLEHLTHWIAQFARDSGSLKAIGVSVPGLLDKRDQKILISPNVHVLDGHRLAEDLHRATQLPIALIQESHALCLAERTVGAACGLADFAMLDVSEGMGLGIVLDGRQLDGSNGLAGELGHITVNAGPDARLCGCGNRGCLETEATDTAFVEAVSHAAGRHWTMDELAESVASGKWETQLLRTLSYLAIGLAAVINVFNPKAIFINSRLLDLRSDLFDILLTNARDRALAPAFADCRIIRAQGSKLQGAVEAAINQAVTEFFSATSHFAGQSDHHTSSKGEHHD